MSAQFCAGCSDGVTGNQGDAAAFARYSAPGELRRKVSFGAVVNVVEEVRGERYTVFMSRRADWARPLLLWSARRFCGLTLKEIGESAGGMDYTAVAMASLLLFCTS